MSGQVMYALVVPQLQPARGLFGKKGLLCGCYEQGAH